MAKEIAVLYIGSMAAWCNSFRRYNALSAIYPQAVVINTDPYILPKYMSGFQHHLNMGPGIFLLNKKIRKATTDKKYDVVLVDNKTYLSVTTLQFIKQQCPATKIVNLLTDDPFGKFSSSWGLQRKTAKYYDIIFVQRQVNIAEFKNVGAKRVEVCYRSFDPEFNRPILLEPEDEKRYGTSIGFVGTYEDIRATYIAYLIEQGIPVSVIGNDWPNGACWDIIKPYYRGPSVFEGEYVKSVNGMKIALHFLRHANRDEQDSRTFEIPSCKVFMLAERSALHLQLFKENEEAVFFTSKEELLEKVQMYMGDKAAREQIALNGYKRCFSDGYDHQSRMKSVMETVMSIVN
ncbi:hypothetical protein BH11BAC5_BH11BAC5_30210 [soil metagenome]